MPTVDDFFNNEIDWAKGGSGGGDTISLTAGGQLYFGNKPYKKYLKGKFQDVYFGYNAKEDAILLSKNSPDGEGSRTYSISAGRPASYYGSYGKMVATVKVPQELLDKHRDKLKVRNAVALKVAAKNANTLVLVRA
jgi:hypothetical protein